MKRKILAFAGTILATLPLFLMTGCEEPRPVATMPKGQLVYDASVAGKLERIKFGEHVYIIRTQNYGNVGLGGICHDPDCPCESTLR